MNKYNKKVPNQVTTSQLAEIKLLNIFSNINFYQIEQVTITHVKYNRLTFHRSGENFPGKPQLQQGMFAGK